MLSLHFEPPMSGPPDVSDPLPYVRLTWDTLLVGPDNRPLATHREGAWQLDDRRFITILIPTPTVVRFEHDGPLCSRRYGPFDQLHIVDGALRHGPHSRNLLAAIDEVSRTWRVSPERRNCPVAVIEPCGAVVA